MEEYGVNLAPLDEHNLELIRLVAPKDHKNPTPAEDFVYDLIAVGAGSGGLVSSKQTARRGFRSALIEFNLAGGDCLNYGCVPSKALLRCASAVKEMKRAAEFGVNVSGEIKVDFPAVMKRMRKLRTKIAPVDSYAAAQAVGVDVYRGRATFTGPNTLEVAGQTLKFKHAVLACGGRPRKPDIKGLETVNYLTNENLFFLEEQPEHMVVMGGGPIGLEMAQAFALMGTKITVVSNSMLGKEDRDAAQIVLKHMEEDGVEMLVGSSVEYVEKDPKDASRINVCVSVRGEKNKIVNCDQILIATGRIPNVDNIGLEAAGVKFDPTGVHMNEFMQTTNENIYAVGDVTKLAKFTHLSGNMAIKVVENIFFGYKHKHTDILLPWVTYTHPEVAHVGVYEHESKEALDTYTASLEHNDRAILESSNDGFVRVHCQKGTGKIVGATIVAENAGEMLSELTVAMQFGISLGETGLGKVIHSYPTVAEAVGGVAFQYKVKNWKFRDSDGKIKGGE